MKKISFDLISNAKDSLRHAINQLTSIDGVGSAEYKQAILSISHATELLLKERLRRVHPAFMWDNVDKYPSLDARTVSTARAIGRLESVDGVEIASEDKAALQSCRVMRNAIEHHKFEVVEKEAKVVLGRTLSFLFDFGSRELDLDLDEEFKSDDTWECLLMDLFEFAEAHGQRLAALLAEEGVPTTGCQFCGADTVHMIIESCQLCGHLWDPEDD